LAYHSSVVIVETGAFTARIRMFLQDEEYRRLQASLLLAYVKNERDDLSEAQKRALRHIIETEYP
jgi:hypothetical protein